MPFFEQRVPVSLGKSNNLTIDSKVRVISTKINNKYGQMLLSTSVTNETSVSDISGYIGREITSLAAISL